MMYWLEKSDRQTDRQTGLELSQSWLCFTFLILFTCYFSLARHGKRESIIITFPLFSYQGIPAARFVARLRRLAVCGDWGRWEAFVLYLVSS